ncbi:hypothetical protein DXG03_009501 [Asterophora parasitica]|uniref:Anoctamin transmembrane domain-containing protein n=1 Tax=Asterophora parasitica TaxID=117018 RepID=A0A9P7K9V4_9AGAR|nr:hypothetical protein DXG03_009501 [Asterophora parasitica]
MALVPRFLALYRSLAGKMTTWENHAHHSTHAASLTLKTFALSALVAYLGIGLTAFVYVPFGAGVMQILQAWIFKETTTGHFKALNNTASDGVSEEKPIAASGGFWDMDASSALHKLNHGRLKEQMFASMVTNQVVNTLTEVGLPFVFRAIASLRNSKKTAEGANTKSGVKKRVVFEDEKEKGGMEEREFLDRVRAEAALPDYEIFTDYDEMVTQFGYIALWSTIWPLAPGGFYVSTFLAR